PDVLVDSLIVQTRENGILRTWEKKEYFLESRHSDRHYVTSIDEEDQTIIIFSDGVLGMKPIEGDSILVSYRYGGGKLGNLAPNLITNVYEEDFDLDFIDSVTNEDYSTGGSDYEDISETKI